MKWLIGGVIILVIIVAVMSISHANLTTVEQKGTSLVSAIKNKITGAPQPQMQALPPKGTFAYSSSYYGLPSSDANVLAAISNGYLTTPPVAGIWFVTKPNPPFTVTNWSNTNPLIQ